MSLFKLSVSLMLVVCLMLAQPGTKFAVDTQLVIRTAIALDAPSSDDLIDFATRNQGVFVFTSANAPKIAYKYWAPGYGDPRWVNEKIEEAALAIPVINFKNDFRFSAFLRNTELTPAPRVVLLVPDSAFTKSAIIQINAQIQGQCKHLLRTFALQAKMLPRAEAFRAQVLITLTRQPAPSINVVVQQLQPLINLQ
ncbi:hypothetical protein WDZ92_23860 [Nostoc sp. NIES-2111]